MSPPGRLNCKRLSKLLAAAASRLKPDEPALGLLPCEFLLQLSRVLNHSEEVRGLSEKKPAQ